MDSMKAIHYFVNVIFYASTFAEVIVDNPTRDYRICISHNEGDNWIACVEQILL